MPTALTYQQEAKALENMRRDGGHFAGKLAEAWWYADRENAAILRASFGHLLEQYLY